MDFIHDKYQTSYSANHTMYHLNMPKLGQIIHKINQNEKDLKMQSGQKITCSKMSYKHQYWSTNQALRLEVYSQVKNKHKHQNQYLNENYMKKGSNEITSIIRKSPNLILKPGVQSFHISHA